MISNKRRTIFPFSVITGLTIALVLVLVASVPFGHALEIHHLFSSIDHDGHQHSDFDLCQWVQQHTSSSLAFDFPLLAEWSWISSRLVLANKQIPQSFSSRLFHSRGPPTFLIF